MLATVIETGNLNNVSNALIIVIIRIVDIISSSIQSLINDMRIIRLGKGCLDTTHLHSQCSICFRISGHSAN